MVTTFRLGLAVVVVGLSLATLDARQAPAARQYRVDDALGLFQRDFGHARLPGEAAMV